MSQNEQAIVVVGQTPPPYGGQAVMIQLLLDGSYTNCNLVHVRMEFSKQLGAIGKWQMGKVVSLGQVIVAVYKARFKSKAKILYYPPCGPTHLAVVRDIAVLCTTRYLFSATIFHFHASGLSEYKRHLPRPLRKLFDMAYGRPTVAIRLSDHAPSEGRALGCKHEYVVRNGIPDAARQEIFRAESQFINLLFVGLLCEDKGVLIAVQTTLKLHEMGFPVRATFIGGWGSLAFKMRVMSVLKNAPEDLVRFDGVLSGEDKWQRYRRADIFIFPSFFHSETSPVVLMEAMCFSLPIATTRWRGIPDVVESTVNAYLGEPEDAQSFLEAVTPLVREFGLRRSMGSASRELFLQRFLVQHYWKSMDNVFTRTMGEV